jgi:hypothetical protein
MPFSISYLFKGGRQEPQQLVDRGIAAEEASQTGEALPLRDEAGFIQALEDAYRKMRRNWCNASENPVEP